MSHTLRLIPILSDCIANTHHILPFGSTKLMLTAVLTDSTDSECKMVMIIGVVAMLPYGTWSTAVPGVHMSSVLSSKTQTPILEDILCT